MRYTLLALAGLVCLVEAMRLFDNRPEKLYAEARRDRVKRLMMEDGYELRG